MRLCDLPIPDSARQHKLDLEPHEDLPEIEDDEIEDDTGEPEPKASERFMQAARAVECAEDVARWNERLKEVTKQKPVEHKQE